MLQARKILVLRFSSIGDIILTTPVIRCMQLQLKNAEIHYLTRSVYKPLLEHNPYIYRLMGFHQSPKEFLPQLKTEHYDYVVDLHRNFRTLGLRFRLLTPSASFPKLNFRKWLLVNFHIDTLPNIHIVDRYFEAVKHLGVINDQQGLELFIAEKDEISVSEFPINFRDGYGVMAIGAKHYTKQIPPELAIEIIRLSPLPFLLVGGKEDHDKGEQIHQLVPLKSQNICGKYTLPQTAAIVKKAKIVITSDTSIMHIAAAFRKPIVSIWGNTVPQFGMYPYMPRNEEKSIIIENKELKCRPCSKLGYSKCPKGHFNCMKQHNPQRILEAIVKLLDSSH
ncbi:MAG TPA: glycosyl transferase [Bacteroidales bacterium]|nr:glycosyl transferase [Bacteroidales bacterium]